MNSQKMRRSEFLITDEKIIDQILCEITWGTLGLIDLEGKPYQVPLNFIWYDRNLYFHSALAGKKLPIIQASPYVHVSLVEPLALIPSYFTGVEMACNATQFFLSVSVEGKAGSVSDPEKKAAVLSAMMQRLQPEGRYKTLDIQNPEYSKEVKKTNVMEIIPDSMTAKFKLGQNLKPEVKTQVIAMLKERGSKIDLLTAQWMEQSFRHEDH